MHLITELEDIGNKNNETRIEKLGRKTKNLK